ncbi:dTDP-4-dehydrorhamnose reductase [Mailhella sp.]|uniref:dTDP-4-dehydrorhamnose reductase n=1 Tax=Mailhella sp. TaxID=1981029 RepID=UPI00406306C6
MLLVTGANGQLGSELRLLLGDSAVYVDRDELDITDEIAVRAFFAEQEFDFVINCAAYTAVDKAEDDFEAADRINRLGPALLAKYGRCVIQVSTDYVFDGTTHLPYKEDDVANPTSVYGSTKLAGEKAVLADGETAVVIRTAWLYSSFGANFVKTMRRLGAERDSLGVIFDQIGTPTYAADLAAAIVAMLPQIKAGTKEIYHYSNEGVASWYDFAVAIMAESGLPCAVRPLETSEYPTKAARPAYSVLNKTKIRRDFGIVIPHWMDGLKRCIATLNEQA